MFACTCLTQASYFARLTQANRVPVHSGQASGERAQGVNQTRLRLESGLLLARQFFPRVATKQPHHHCTPTPHGQRAEALSKFDEADAAGPHVRHHPEGETREVICLSRASPTPIPKPDAASLRIPDTDAEGGYPKLAAYVQLHFWPNLTKMNKFNAYLFFHEYAKVVYLSLIKEIRMRTWGTTHHTIK